MRILYDRRPYLVLAVNDCCAKIVPEERRVRLICPQTGRHAGERIQISARAPMVHISPDSEVEVLA